MEENSFDRSAILYHGTKVAFDKFDFEKAVDGAHFFTPIKEHAEHFGHVKAYRVAINNPLIISQDDLEKEWDKEHPEGEQDDRYLLPRDFVDEFVLQAKAKGHDGLIIESFADLDFQTTVYLPFSADQILETNMQANDGATDKLYAVLHDDALNYWTGAYWEGTIEEAARFDPVKGLAAAYHLEEIYKNHLENTPVIMRVVDDGSPSDDQGKYVINTSQAKNWPQLEAAFKKVFGVTLDRDMAIAFQHDAKRTDVKTVREHELEKGGIKYFSFSIRIPRDETYTHWMTVVDGVLYEARAMDDEAYSEKDVVPLSLVVSIPAPSDAYIDPLRPSIHESFLKAISEKVGFRVNVPMLCEADDAAEITRLKKLAGYEWSADDLDYLKVTPSIADPEVDQKINFMQTLPERRQFMKDRNTLESIVYAQATVQMLSHSSSFKNALEAFDYLGHCVKKQVEPIGLVRKAPFETMDWPRVHDYVQVMANQNIATMKNLLDVAHKGMVAGAMEGEFDSADMNLLDLEDMMDRGNGLEAIKIPQSIAPGVSSPKYTDRALVAARGDNVIVLPLVDLKAVAYVDDESGVPAIKAQSPAVLEELYKRAIAPGSIVLSQDKPLGVDTWFFDLDDIDASFDDMSKVLARWDVPAETITGVITDLKAVHGRHDYVVSETLEDAKALVHEVLRKLDFPKSEWRQATTSITPWEYTDVDVGGYRPLVLGASSGGVVSVDGDPFTPERRETNVTLARVMSSVEKGIEELTNVNMVNVAIYDTRNAAFADIGKQVEVVRILKEAAKFIRDNDVYEGLALHDVNGNKVGAISGGWGNMGNDVHAAFVNLGDSKQVARLIDEVANFVEKGTTVFYLHDIEGKNIGQGATIEWVEEQALDRAVDDVHNDMQM